MRIFFDIKNSSDSRERVERSKIKIISHQGQIFVNGSVVITLLGSRRFIVNKIEFKQIVDTLACVTAS